MRTLRQIPSKCRQRGVAAVEFALLSLFVFFPLMLGLIEISRYMFLYNTMQEVTRRAAREATVRWTSDADQTIAKRRGYFGKTHAPTDTSIDMDMISITYLNANLTEVSGANLPLNAADNLSACNDALRTQSCINTVKVEMSGVQFTPWIGRSSLFNSDLLKIAMPKATVYMYAESMGFTN